MFFESMVVSCWPTFNDAGIIVKQHWFTVLYLLGFTAKYQSARMDSPSAKKTKSSVKKRLGQQPIHHSTPVSQTQRIPPLRLQQGKAFKPLPDIERKVQVFSRSKREDIMRQLRSGPSVTDQASVTSEEVEEEEEEEEKSVDEGNEEERGGKGVYRYGGARGDTCCGREGERRG